MIARVILSLWLSTLAISTRAGRLLSDPNGCELLRVGDESCMSPIQQPSNLRSRSIESQTADNTTPYLNPQETSVYRRLFGNPIYFVNPAVVPKGPSDGSDYGFTVVTNGNTLIVGADSYNSYAGLIEILLCEGTTCTRNSTITNPAGANVQGLFGQAIGSIDTYLAVGAPRGDSSGVVYLFDITSPSAPVQLNKILPTSSAGTTQLTQFGVALALYTLPMTLISPTTDPRALILAVGDTGFNNKQGKLYFISINRASYRTSSLWEVTLPAMSGSPTPQRQLGYPIIQSGGWVVTSAQGDYSTTPILPAAVYVYACLANIASTCGQVGGAITTSDAAEDEIRFGYMMALQKDFITENGINRISATLVAGALQFGEANKKGNGAAYVYKYVDTNPSSTGGSWTLMSRLQPLPEDGAYPHFGSGVALSSGTLVVSAPLGDSSRGSLYVYYVHDGVVTEVIQRITCAGTNSALLTAGCDNSQFGDNALALSGTATFLAVGARTAFGGYSKDPVTGRDVVRTGTGAVYIYSTAPTAAPTASPTNPTAYPTHTPTYLPTPEPTFPFPTPMPTLAPTPDPSSLPTLKPSGHPTGAPSGQPSRQPTGQPTRHPSRQPTGQPTMQPYSKPTGQPSRQPTGQPTRQPSRQPSGQPTMQPYSKPTGQPSSQPSASPSKLPTPIPSPM